MDRAEIIDQFMPEAEKNAQVAGQKCVERVQALCKKYEALWRALHEYGGVSEVSDDPASLNVIIDRDRSIAGLGEGDVSINITPFNINNVSALEDADPTDFSIRAFFTRRHVEPYQERIRWGKAEAFGESFLHNAIWGRYSPEKPIEWRRSDVGKARAHVEAIEAPAHQTFDLILESARNPMLNPEMAERAQAYRDSLSEAG